MSNLSLRTPTVVATAVLVAASIGACGGTSSTSGAKKSPPTTQDVTALRHAFVDVSMQCIEGVKAQMPGSTSSGPDITALSRDVTTTVELYRRTDPNATIQSTGATTVRQYIDQTIAFLNKPYCAPSLGQRLQAETSP